MSLLFIINRNQSGYVSVARLLKPPFPPSMVRCWSTRLGTFCCSLFALVFVFCYMALNRGIYGMVRGLGCTRYRVDCQRLLKRLKIVWSFGRGDARKGAGFVGLWGHAKVGHYLLGLGGIEKIVTIETPSPRAGRGCLGKPRPQGQDGAT